MGYIFYREMYRDGKDTNGYLNECSQMNEKSVMGKMFENRSNYVFLMPECIPSAKPKRLDELQSVGISAFTMKVEYPGLYAGLGYAHGIGDQGGNTTDTDFKNGFSFDYTTGLPYLPGSSVKGALRACFHERKDDTLQAVKAAIGGTDSWTKKNLKEMEISVFGNDLNKEGEEGSFVFFDAFPCKAKDGKLMVEDYITPQRKNPFGDPKPIRNIKIQSGVYMRFLFRAPEIVPLNGVKIIRSQWVTLFSALLADWGIGAKTRSGYGTLSGV